jgi:hypothetical protein
LGVVILCTLLSRSICPGQTIVAKTAVELLAALRHPADNTTIRLSAGTYYFPRPIQIPAAFGLVLEADPKAEVVLSAGELIADWKPDTLNGHDGWSAYLPEVRLGILDFRELWVNGARAKRARFPATGYLLSHQSPDKEKPWNQGQTWFGYKPGDLPDELPVDAEAMVMNRWEDSRLPDLSVDAIHHRVNSSRKTVFQPQDGDPYFLEGASDWLANPVLPAARGGNAGAGGGGCADARSYSRSETWNECHAARVDVFAQRMEPARAVAGTGSKTGRLRTGGDWCATGGGAGELRALPS